MSTLRYLLVVTLLSFSLILAASADEVFVSNQPFAGQVLGTGSKTRLKLDDLASALESVADRGEDGWTIDGFPVETTQENGVVWVEVGALPEGLVRVIRSDELETLDIYKVEQTSAFIDEDWGGQGTLVCFYGAWSPACRAMNNTLAVLAQSRTLELRILDIDRPGTPEFREYARYFSGNKIPYFVVIDDQGRKLHSFAGLTSYGDTLKEIKAAFAKQK